MPGFAEPDGVPDSAKLALLDESDPEPPQPASESNTRSALMNAVDGCLM